MRIAVTGAAGHLGRLVIAALESKGVAGNRLESEGFGETNPIDTNRTPGGRARNRRVEFVILKPAN